MNYPSKVPLLSWNGMHCKTMKEDAANVYGYTYTMSKQ